MPKVRIGAQLAPQRTTYAGFAQAVCQVEQLGVDTIWNWDHFVPPFFSSPPPDRPEDPNWENHFEAWTLLTAMAMLTRRAEVGCLVTSAGYRNPALLSNMAKTVDHISGGRLILGLGAGWFEKDYREYGYVYDSDRERLRTLESALPLIQKRWEIDKPLPLRKIPIMIGGEGEKITLRLVAQYADLWNSGSEPEKFKHKCSVLNEWCMKVGRDPSAIERTVNYYGQADPAAWDAYVAAGAQHIILNITSPWDLTPLEQLIRWNS